jgi:copper oxidase (laccase) domain-containing protein
VNDNVYEIGNFRFGFSTRSDGDMSRTDSTRATAVSNRQRFLDRLGLGTSDRALIRVCHSANVDLIEFEPRLLRRTTFREPPVVTTDFENVLDGSDGIVTLDPNVVVVLVTGDCVPLVVWDESSGLHGVVHIGMVGALNRIVSSLGRAIDATGVARQSVDVFLGPSIGKTDYDISRSGLWAAIEDQALAKVPGLTAFLHRTDSGHFFDIQGLVRSQLLDEGFTNDRIDTYPRSTAESDSPFYSHFAEKTEPSGRTPRMMTAIGVR